MRRRGTLLTALSVCAVLVSTAAPATAAVGPAERAAEASFAASAGLPGGAIASYPDRTRVDPYLGGFAAWGMADQAGRTRDRGLLASTWSYLRWYAGAQDAQGYVTDYSVSPGGALTSTGDMDSTDSYAAVFLLATEAAYQASSRVEGSASAKKRLKALADGLDGALRAVESTVNADGLTWAKPGWRVKYLMDQAEVYAGLASAGRLFAVLGDRGRGNRARAVSAGVATGVEGLWDPARGSYDWARHEGGGSQPADLTVLYPDAMEQVWAVAFGLVPTSRATALLARVKQLHPQLSDPGALDQMGWGAGPVGYWPMAAAAWAAVGDVAEADRLLTAIEGSARTAGRPWPWNSGTAGQVLVVSGQLLDR